MLNFQGAVYQDSVLLTHAPPLGWVSFPRKTWVSFNYKSITTDFRLHIFKNIFHVVTPILNLGIEKAVNLIRLTAQNTDITLS